MGVDKSIHALKEKGDLRHMSCDSSHKTIFIYGPWRLSRQLGSTVATILAYHHCYLFYSFTFPFLFFSLFYFPTFFILFFKFFSLFLLFPIIFFIFFYTFVHFLIYLFFIFSLFLFFHFFYRSIFLIDLCSIFFFLKLLMDCLPSYQIH